MPGSLSKKEFINLFLKACLNASLKAVKERNLLYASSNGSLYVVEIDNKRLCINKSIVSNVSFTVTENSGGKEITYTGDQFTEEEFAELHFAYLMATVRPDYLKQTPGIKLPIVYNKPALYKSRIVWIFIFLICQIALYCIVQLKQIDFWTALLYGGFVSLTTLALVKTIQLKNKKTSAS